MSTETAPEPPIPPPQTLLERYGTGAELMYRYRIEIEQGEAHRRAVGEMLAHMAGDKRRR